MVIDWLAAGIDPSSATLFIQSPSTRARRAAPAAVHVHAIGWLERVPTYKDQQDKLNDKDLSTYGFLGLPPAAGG